MDGYAIWGMVDGSKRGRAAAITQGRIEVTKYY
jgi:hypothetical protein